MINLEKHTELHSEQLSKEYAPLSGQSMIYFGPGKWDGMWRNRHQLMSRFSKTNKVLYVEPLIEIRKLFQQILSLKFLKSEFWKDFCVKRVRQVSSNLYVYNSLLYIPISGRFPLDKITWWIWELFLKRSLAKLGFDHPIIWLSLPKMARFIGSFSEKLSIYHIVDEYSSYGNADNTAKMKIKSMECKLLKRADLVIVVSENLYKTKKPYNENTHIVTNGVDFNAYNNALSDNFTLPQDISELQKPIIGYSGLISQRLDLDLVSFLANSHPEWTLALIGEVNEKGCENEIAKLKAMKNVFFLGSKTIEQVPYYVKAFDVCIVPYKNNEQTKNLSPLKLFDFMSTGKEIVTTDFPVARDYQEVISIATSPNSFKVCIESALAGIDMSHKEKRIEIAARNTWEDRIEELSGIIKPYLENRTI